MLSIADVSELPDGVTLDGSTLTIDPSAEAFQGLAEGATQDITVNFNVVDAAGEATAQSATITITGTDEAPVVVDETIFILEDGGDEVIGTELDETFIGGNGDDTVFGGGGNDELQGNAGNDTLTGGTGDDIIIGGTGDDELFGGFGDDTYIFNAGDGADIIFESGGIDTVNFVDFAVADAEFSSTFDGILIDFGSGDSVELSFLAAVPTPIDNDELLFIGGGDDVFLDDFGGDFGDEIIIIGGEGDEGDEGFPADVEIFQFTDQTLTLDDVFDLAFGTLAELTIEGTAGDDVLVGDEFNEEIFGLAGDDTIEGGLGNDILNGGSGNDSYIYTLGDGIDLINDIAGDNDSLTLIGVTSFTPFSDEFGNDVIAILDPLTETNESISIVGQIETFIFIADPDNPEDVEVLTNEELFGDSFISIEEPEALF